MQLAIISRAQERVGTKRLLLHALTQEALRGTSHALTKKAEWKKKKRFFEGKGRRLVSSSVGGGADPSRSRVY